VHRETLKPQLKQLRFPHEAGHVICYSRGTRRTEYFATVRSNTFCSAQGRIKGVATGAIATGPPLQGGPP